MAKFAFFFIKFKDFVTNFRLNAYQNVFYCVFLIFLGPSAYILMRGNNKNQNIYFLKKCEKKEDSCLFSVVRAGPYGVVSTAAFHARVRFPVSAV